MTTPSAQSLYSLVPGRLGQIYDQVYVFTNDTKGGTSTTYRYETDANLGVFVRACIQEIALTNYWESNLTLDVVANQDTYDLRTSIPGLVRVIRVRMTAANQDCDMLGDWERFSSLKKHWQDPENTIAWPWGTYSTSVRIPVFVSGTLLMFARMPLATLTGGMKIYFNYQPPSPGLIVLTNGAPIVNNGNGTVTIAAPANGMIAGDEVDLLITNYTGNYRVIAVTADTFTIPETYSSHTVNTATDKGYLQPRWPAVNDNVLSNYLIQAHILRDRTNPNYQGLLNRDLEYPPYVRARGKLIRNASPQAITLYPGGR